MARPRPRDPDALFAARARPTKPLPFDFVLAELAELAPFTRPMFGCHAVYVGERIVFVLRERRSPPDDDGVWLATTAEHHASLRREMPSLRSIQVLAGGGVTGWQMLPVASEDFEASVLHACALVRAGDARIGKVPKAKRKTAARQSPTRKTAARKSTARKPTARKPTARKRAAPRRSPSR